MMIKWRSLTGPRIDQVTRFQEIEGLRVAYKGK